jgi:hypothetical protein
MMTNDPHEGAEIVNPASRGLWWACVLLADVLCAGWSLGRVKPAWWFATGFGVALAAVALFLAGWLRVRWTTGMICGVAVLAACGVWGAIVGGAVTHQLRSADRHALARRLLAEFPRDNSAEVPAWESGLADRLGRRYGIRASLRWLWPAWLIGEGLLAAGIAAGGTWWLVRREGNTFLESKAAE